MHAEQQPRPAAQDVSVEVILLHLAELQFALPWLGDLLDPAERERAKGCKVAGAREEFVVTRAVLRLLLAERTRVPARDVAFQYGTAGKPTLAPPNPLGVAFNVSHSHGLAAIAVGAVHAVGIDVERIDPEAPVVDLARTAWGPAAAASMRAFASGEERCRAFFRQWVRFEATGKYHGEGVVAGTNSADEGMEEEGLSHREFTRSLRGGRYVGCIVTPRFARVHAATWLTSDDLALLHERNKR